MTGTRQIDGATFHEVRIGMPLPFTLASSLLRLVGEAWPGALLASAEPDGDHRRRAPDEMVMLVPDKPARRVTKKALAELVSDPADDDAVVTEANADHVALAGPAMDEISQFLVPLLQRAFEENPGAMNYLEQRVVDRTPGGYETYVVTAAKASGQTPDQLRRAAEADADAAKTAHDALLSTVRDVLDAAADGTDPADLLAALADVVAGTASLSSTTAASSEDVA